MFEVGDIVRVREDLVGDTSYDGLWFDIDMEEFRGNEYEVSDINGRAGYYDLRGIGCNSYASERISGWLWNDAMLESVTPDEELEESDIPIDFLM